MKFIEISISMSISSSIPDLFRCPISLELFTDPVTLSTGQTYDRPFIEKWLSSGNLTCPVTMQKLTDLSLVPNHTLTHLIQQWRHSNHSHCSLPTSLPPPLPHADDDDESDSLVNLKRTLEDNSIELESGWEEEEKTLQAVRKVHILSLDVSNGENLGLVRLGFFPVLIELVLNKAKKIGIHGGSYNMEIVEEALSAAVKLMLYCHDDVTSLNSRMMMITKFESFISLLKQGSCGIKISLCRVLETIVSSPQMKDVCDMVSNSEEVLSGLVNIVDIDCDWSKTVNVNDRNYDENDYNEDNNVLSEAGVKAILALCGAGTDNGQEQQETIASVQVKLVKFGAIGALIRCIWRDLTKGISNSRVPAALEVVEILVKVEGGKEALLREPDGVRVLVRSVFRVLDHHHGGSESAVKCLMGVCMESREAREEAVRDGVVTQLLLLIQSQCSGRTKARGRMMLKMLRTVWGKEENGSWKGWCGVG